MTDIDNLKELHHGVGTRGVVVTCAVDGEVWPCEKLNLASELEAARKVVAEMREMVDQCDLTITWRNERGMKPATDISIFAPTALSGVIKIKRYFEQALAEYLRVMEEQR